jgi:FkbM family methyltransferase
MKLFVGTAFIGAKPEGYTTIDIDAANSPDILADAADLSMIQTGVADEFYASHVLEHFPWPRALLVLAEWARVLKVDGSLKLAVPDMEVYARLLLEGQNPWHVTRSIYGAHSQTPGGPQGHHHGYTKRMLIDALTLLGFGDFDVWSSDYAEAANGWLYTEDGEELGMSLNIMAFKKGPPNLDVRQLVQACEQQPFVPPMKLAREIMVDGNVPAHPDALLYQRLHFKFIIERNERLRLENERKRLLDELTAIRNQSQASGATQPIEESALVALPPGGLGPWNYKGHADQPFGAISYAQFGEDLLLLNLFSALGIENPRYIDVGAHHPVNCSNTALLYARGSRGVCVEANPNLIAAFAELRPEDLTLNVGCGTNEGTLEFYMIDHASGRNTFDRATAEAFVVAHPQFSIREVRRIPVLPLDAIVAQHCGGRWPEFLSLDVEGLDFAVLEASRLNDAEGPRVICVEAVAGNDTDSGSVIERLLATRGFVPAARTVANLIFCRRADLPRWTKSH